MTSLSPWQLLHSQYLLRKRWLNVRQDVVRTARGITIDEFHVLEVPSWACICCVSESGELVLTRQYRHGAGQVTLELPAGVIEPGESPEQGARRELLEETGYTADSWLLLATLTPEPARHTHLAHCFFATEAVSTNQQKLDDNEDLVVERVPVDQALRLVQDGSLNHAVHVAAVLLAVQSGLLPG